MNSAPLPVSHKRRSTVPSPSATISIDERRESFITRSPMLKNAKKNLKDTFFQCYASTSPKGKGSGSGGSGRGGSGISEGMINTNWKHHESEVTESTRSISTENSPKPPAYELQPQIADL